MGDSPVNEHSHPHKGTESSNFHDPEKATHFVKNPASSFEADHGAETDLRRSLGTRHLTMIGLGASIGMGLWLGSGTSLVHGGPAAIFIGYVLSGSIVWSVTHSIGELGSLYPLPSAFVQWSSKFVDPAAGFALGWAYWLFYWIAIANELQGIVTVLNFWTDEVPTAGWITIFWVVIILINIWGVSFFAEIEVVSSFIKFTWIFVIIISMIVISAGAGPTRDAIGFKYWKSEPFTHGFKGFLAVMPTCIFAMAGSETFGLVAAETAVPRKALPKAVGSIWVRLSLFYILGSLMVTITVSPNDPNLFGGDGSGTNASPFVIAYRSAGLPALAHIMNAIILISVISSASINAYGGSRTIMGLAHLGMAPKFFGKADSLGRPVAGLFVTILLGGSLAYLNVNHSGAQVFTWLADLTSLYSLFGWGMICLSNLRMRYAWKLQGRSPSELPWRSWAFPYGPLWGLSWSIILIVVEFYLSVWPLDGSPTAKNFFANYVSVIAIIVIYLGARIYYRGRWWVDARTLELDEGRRFYADHENEETRGQKRWQKRVRKGLSILTN